VEKALNLKTNNVKIFFEAEESDLLIGDADKLFKYFISPDFINYKIVTKNQSRLLHLCDFDFEDGDSETITPVNQGQVLQLFDKPFFLDYLKKHPVVFLVDGCRGPGLVIIEDLGERNFIAKIYEAKLAFLLVRKGMGLLSASPLPGPFVKS
jgi:hypothetical protein